MPRISRTPERKTRHHKPMHSGRHGLGHDALMKRKKQEIGKQRANRTKRDDHQ